MECPFCTSSLIHDGICYECGVDVAQLRSRPHDLIAAGPGDSATAGELPNLLAKVENSVCTASTLLGVYDVPVTTRGWGARVGLSVPPMHMLDGGDCKVMLG